MILVGLALAVILYVLACDGVTPREASPAQPSHTHTRAFDALIFLLCLAGILAHAHHKRGDDDD